MEAIGQAFADEVFRVFKIKHPDIEVMSLNANEEVTQMIKRAQGSFDT
ncbi:MAG: STAS-like domain-containing protein [Pseudanabaenales cyanobacterium]|nr:STAS-like domain-containing protein [Pseudanabaenales cyanobacterium]